MPYTPGDTFSASIGVTSTWNVSKNQAGAAATGNNSTVQKNQAYTKGTTAAGTADTVVSTIVSIAGNGTGGYFLSSATPSFSDLLGQAGVIFARIKAMSIRLISAAEDATNGGNASSITIGAGVTPFNGPLGGTAPTVTLKIGDVWTWATSDGTAYVVTAASNDRLNITNNDVSNAAKVQINIIGASA